MLSSSSRIDLQNGGFLSKLVITASVVAAPNITEVYNMTIDQPTYLEMDSLASVDKLQVDGGDDRVIARLPNLRSIWEASMRNIANSDFEWQDVAVESSLQLGPSVPATIYNPFFYGITSGIISIGMNLIIQENGNCSFVFRKLIFIGGNVDIVGNWNSTFNFREVTRLMSLSMRNNTNSTLPGDFLNLEEAESIYLNGVIDTTAGSNIFPSLKRVRGSVVVEAWNKEFNCSKLGSLHQNGIINDLRCNGTDNGTLAATGGTNETASHAVISQGAWAGIGIGGGLLFLGVLGAAAWFILRSRRRGAHNPGGTQTENQQQPSYSTHEHASEGLYEAGGKPCGSGRAQLEGAEIQEIGGEQVPGKKTDEFMAKESKFQTA
ncbi:hypothetical protein DL769_011222 [Monosporascus sp. CRB-8-3]|nr:hypothetical protein DL769_011222 [Monosporascus sp. CRB-8-3]